MPDGLDPDAPAPEAADEPSVHALLARERATHVRCALTLKFKLSPYFALKMTRLLKKNELQQAETEKELQVERAAHDETAEKMVQLQQRLEVTLQELANLERFTKRQQTVQTTVADAPPNVERLLKEESYLKSRLLFVQQVHARYAEKACTPVRTFTRAPAAATPTGTSGRARRGAPNKEGIVRRRGARNGICAEHLSCSSRYTCKLAHVGCCVANRLHVSPVLS